MLWLEVSLIVAVELAEAVSELLSRYAPNGVVIESTIIEADLASEGQVVGPLRVFAYLPIDEKTEEIRQQIERALWFMGRIQPIPAPNFKIIQEDDWAKTWKKNYKPIVVGNRIKIVPAWMDPTDDSRLPVFINPGKAFGTGTHPSTQLCLQMLEDHVPVGKEVLDIGCGSGILSIAALKLGAGYVYGVDVDVEAVEDAWKNAEINRMSDLVQFAPGSVKEIKEGIFPVKSAPLVLANILAYILNRLMDDGLADVVSPGGKLIMSGILEEQLPEITRKITCQGLTIMDRREIDDWVALTVHRESSVIV